METTWPPTDLRHLTTASTTIRQQRTSLLDHLACAPTTKSSRIRGARVLMQPPAQLQRARAIRVLRACRHVGTVRGKAMLQRAGVAEDARIGELTFEQRAELAVALLALTKPEASS